MTAFVSALLGPRYRAGTAPTQLMPGQSQVRDRLLLESQAQDWEAPDCLCGEAGGRVVSEVDRHGLPYRKVLCPRCGLLRATPRWTAARYARFYEEDYRDLYSPLRSGNAPEQTLRQLADGPGATLVSEFVISAWQRHGDSAQPRPTIVEIGAGGGWNLSRLPPNWHRIGFDSDERFLRLGRETFGVDMRRGFFDEALPAAAQADCVLMSHVLEHVADPVATLQRLCAALRPQTLVLVEVPGLFRLHKTALDPMRYWQNAHTYTFCARTVADTCRRAGLEPLAVDEWIRLVLRPSHRADRATVDDDPSLAASVERYLRFCETAYGAVASTSRLPLVGPIAGRIVRRGSDALVRLAEHAGQVHGTRAGRLQGDKA
jgi:SAM-dependent methyltransferase